MPRAKLPGYYKEYEVRFSVTGDTEAQAEYNFNHAYSYHKRWIKGNYSGRTKYGPCLDDDFNWKIECILTFTKGSLEEVEADESID